MGWLPASSLGSALRERKEVDNGRWAILISTTRFVARAPLSCLLGGPSGSS